MACQMVPLELFAPQRYEQLKRLLLKRDRKGRILKESDISDINYQLPLITI